MTKERKPKRKGRDPNWLERGKIETNVPPPGPKIRHWSIKAMAQKVPVGGSIRIYRKRILNSYYQAFYQLGYKCKAIREGRYFRIWRIG